MIAVVGGSTCPESEAAVAYAVGHEIAVRGHTLVCGGYGGVMAAAARGAREAGGHTIGILSGDDRSGANEWIEFAIVTGMGHARNAIIARTADALVAVGGKYGTLSEIAFALILGRPVAGLGTWSCTSPDGDTVPIRHCATVAEALDYCEQPGA
jgi:uncharacterized protein (TIGR00725 family)